MYDSTHISQILNGTTSMLMVYKHQHVIKSRIGHLIEMCFKYQIESKSMFKYINHKQTTSKALENKISSWGGEIQPKKERKHKEEEK